MNRATQEEIDKFFNWAVLDPEMYPYLTINKTIFKKEIPKDDWEGLMFISECGKCFMHISFSRVRDIEFNVSIWSKSPLLAGRCLIVIKDLIKRYRPKYIDSVCHSSNKRSLKLHKKIYGVQWGIEPNGAWNMGLGEYEDLYHFRLMIT